MKIHNIKNLLSDADVLLKNVSTTAHLDAQLLLCYVLGKDRSYIFSHPEAILSDTQYQQWQILLKKRQQQIPMAYLIGQKEFWNLILEVNEYTLIPRPETELLVELALTPCRGEWCSPLPLHLSLQCLDLGTGSGAIALAIAKEKPHWHITATDISSQALDVAKRNAQKNDICNITFIQSDWFSSITNKFDMIVSNPPYLDENDSHLIHEEIRHEPRSALVANKNGLDDIEKIILSARDYLQPEGCVLIEHGSTQAEIVRAIFVQYGYQAVKTFRDLAGLERISLGIMCEKSIT